MEYIEYLNSLNAAQFLEYLRKIEENQKYELVSNLYLKNLSDDKFNFLLFNLSVSQIESLLSNEELYDKLMNLEIKSKQRSVFVILSESKPQVLKTLIESQFSKKYLNKFIYFLKNINLEELKKLEKIINFDNIINAYFNDISKDNIIKYINDNFPSVDNDIIQLFYTKFKNNNLNLLNLLRIKNDNDFILYTKFGVMVETIDGCDEINLKNGLVLPKKFILECKDSHIVKLINLLKESEESQDCDLLEASLKLYCIFGFSNAKKIIENKFSKMTTSALYFANDFYYKEQRRVFRTKNQKKFYYHGMEEDIKKSLSTGDIQIFENLLYYPNEEDIIKLRKEFLEILSNSLNSDEIDLKIKNKISENINIRERLYKDENYKRLLNTKYPEPSMNSKYICELLKDVNISKVINFEPNVLERLQSFLLGNTQSNNDCLFRLIVNKLALGLDDNLALLINEFPYFERIIKESKLSNHSVLDIIDVLKIKLYELRPNETDIQLSTITRLVNSSDFRNDYNINVARETCNLHIKRKEKVYSTIPTVSGKTEYFTYEVAPFDAEYLLIAGLDGKNCFRIAGLGEEFFKYCLTNPNAVVVYLKEANGRIHICPIVRSGNAIHCNGIEPEVEDSKKDAAIFALNQCFSKMITNAYKSKNHYENIEVATITDLNMDKYFSNSNYKQYNLEERLPLNFECYNDYNKKHIKHYIITKTNSYSKNYYYLSNAQFYQSRDENYEFDLDEEYDKEKLSLIVNSISYSAIEYMNVPNKIKNALRRNYKQIDVMTYKYIIGNKDWFVAIDQNLNIVANLLPYDKRAKDDYVIALSKAPLIIEKMVGEKIDRKNI